MSGAAASPGWLEQTTLQASGGLVVLRGLGCCLGRHMKANGGFCNEVSGAWMLLWLGCLFKAASLCVGFEQLVIISVTPPPPVL